MDNKKFGQQLEERTLNFALRVIRLSSILPNSPEARIIRNQFTKSGTSVGANYREANRSRSKAVLFIKLRFVNLKQVKPFFG